MFYGRVVARADVLLCVFAEIIILMGTYTLVCRNDVVIGRADSICSDGVKEYGKVLSGVEIVECEQPETSDRWYFVLWNKCHNYGR